MPRKEREFIRDRSPSFGQETRPDPLPQSLTGLGTQPLWLGSWAAAPILMHLAAVRPGGAGGQGQRVAGAEFGPRRDRGRAEERRVGKGCVRTCRSRLSP